MSTSPVSATMPSSSKTEVSSNTSAAARIMNRFINTNSTMEENRGSKRPRTCDNNNVEDDDNEVNIATTAGPSRSGISANYSENFLQQPSQQQSKLPRIENKHQIHLTNVWNNIVDKINQNQNVNKPRNYNITLIGKTNNHRLLSKIYNLNDSWLYEILKDVMEREDVAGLLRDIRTKIGRLYEAKCVDVVLENYDSAANCLNGGASDDCDVESTEKLIFDVDETVHSLIFYIAVAHQSNICDYFKTNNFGIIDTIYNDDHLRYLSELIEILPSDKDDDVIRINGYFIGEIRMKKKDNRVKFDRPEMTNDNLQRILIRRINDLYGQSVIDRRNLFITLSHRMDAIKCEDMLRGNNKCMYALFGLFNITKKPKYLVAKAYISMIFQ